MTNEKDNSGVLFKNEEKTEDRQPDYTGKAKIDGTDYRVAAWVNETKDGSRRYLKLSYTEQIPEQTAPKPQPRAAKIDDGIPF